MSLNGNNSNRVMELKQVLDRLGEAHGRGTSMITLVIAANGSLARVRQHLVEEYSFAGNIKSRV